MRSKITIPDDWPPELALAVSGLLGELEAAIWERYGDEMIGLICPDPPALAPEPRQEPLFPEHDDIPF